MTTINYPTIGKVELMQTSRAKRITLSVMESGRVRLSFPRYVSKKRALQFLEQRQEWAIEMRRKMLSRCVPIVIEEPFSTRHHSLQLINCDADTISARVANRVMTVWFPRSLSHTDEQVQNMIKRAVTEAYRIEAKRSLPAMVEEISQRLGLKYNKLSIRATYSKWGSCSSGGNISLSLYLMMLPDHLIEYVIVHELCHTVHLNHSAEFHDLVDKVLGGREREFVREIRGYNARNFKA